MLLKSVFYPRLLSCRSVRLHAEALLSMLLLAAALLFVSCAHAVNTHGGEVGGSGSGSSGGSSGAGSVRGGNYWKRERPFERRLCA